MSQSVQPVVAVEEALYRYADVIFCDDVRHESTGKLLVVGMYGPVMVVPEAPAVLPSLVAFIRAKSPLDKPFKKFVTRVFFDDEVIAESEIDVQAAELESDAAARKPTSAQVHVVQNLAILRPFPVLKAGILRVRVETESEILRAGALEIRVQKMLGQDEAPDAVASAAE